MPHSYRTGMSAASFEPTIDDVEHCNSAVASLVAFAQPVLPRTAQAGLSELDACLPRTAPAVQSACLPRTAPAEQPACLPWTAQAEQSGCRATSYNWPHRSDNVPQIVVARPVNVLPPTNGCMRLLAASMQLPPSVDPLLVSTTAAEATVETTRLVDGMISHACTNCQRAKIACSSKERPCRRCERLGLPCEELKPIKRACGTCRASKVKCDVDDTYPEPCSRCLRTGTVCAPHEPTKRKRSKPGRAPTPPGPDIWLTGDERSGERYEASTETLASWLASTPFDARPAFDAREVGDGMGMLDDA